MEKQKTKTVPSSFIDDKASDPQAYLELHHWQVQLIGKRLAIADAGGEGFTHTEVFDQLRRHLHAS